MLSISFVGAILGWNEGFEHFLAVWEKCIEKGTESGDAKYYEQ